MRAHEGQERVAGASGLDAQDALLGGQTRNARVHRPERAVQQQVEYHVHQGRRDARHGHLPSAAQRGQDAHRDEITYARLGIKEKWGLALKQDPNPMRVRSGFLPPLHPVARLGDLLGGAPPGLAGAAPLDGLREARRKVGVLRLPTELGTQLGHVDGVASVVAGAVGHPVGVVVAVAHAADDDAAVLEDISTIDQTNTPISHY